MYSQSKYFENIFKNQIFTLSLRSLNTNGKSSFLQTQLKSRKFFKTPWFLSQYLMTAVQNSCLKYLKTKKTNLLYSEIKFTYSCVFAILSSISNGEKEPKTQKTFLFKLNNETLINGLKDQSSAWIRLKNTFFAIVKTLKRWLYVMWFSTQSTSSSSRQSLTLNNKRRPSRLTIKDVFKTSHQWSTSEQTVETYF